MNQVTEEKKETVTKVLAIAGFVAILIFAVWLAVQIVSVIPSAFSSLASLADSVYNYDTEQEFEVATDNSVVNAGESFTIVWTDLRTDGTYTFTYDCAEGVSMEIRDSNGRISSIACDTPVALGTATSLEVLVASEKFRFVEVSYTITFTRKNADPRTIDSAVTIVNASIPATGLAEEVEEEEDEEVEVDQEEEETPEIQTPRTPTYTAGTPTTVKKLIYTIPTSDPNGNIDLQVTFIGVGTLNGSNFTKRSTIDSDDKNALQFEVKNIGTKTADRWSYEATLPSDIAYESNNQKALKPNERAVITLGFEGITDKGGNKVGVEVSAQGDVKKSNNEFSESIKVVD